MSSEDPRMQKGAYITDGTDLYEVTGLQVRPGVAGIRTPRIIVENYCSLRAGEFLPDKIRSAFNLVRPAPAGNCPDTVREIAW